MRKVSAVWLATHGHQCYVAAYNRYRHGRPDALQTFQNECLSCMNGPFEFWAAFVNLLYPAKRLIGSAPGDSLIRNVRTLLLQEEIRRSFA